MAASPAPHHRVRPYQFSLLTGRAPEDVLQELSERRFPDITVAERGESYLILCPQRRRRYGADVAALIGIVITLGVLILTAITPVFIALLPVALLPALPLLFERHAELAVSAIHDNDAHGARVTIHGQASPELAAALDAYLGSLPRQPTQAPVKQEALAG